MTDYLETDSLDDTYIFETSRLLDNLEELILDCEKTGTIIHNYDEIKRILHTIKGNSMILELKIIAQLSHANEDLIAHIKNTNSSYEITNLTDILLESIDFIRNELLNIKENKALSCDISYILSKINNYFQ